jgi:hypothetical protein
VGSPDGIQRAELYLNIGGGTVLAGTNPRVVVPVSMISDASTLAIEKVPDIEAGASPYGITTELTETFAEVTKSNKKVKWQIYLFRNIP